MQRIRHSEGRPQVTGFFDTATSSVQYVVTDPAKARAAGASGGDWHVDGRGAHTKRRGVGEPVHKLWVLLDKERGAAASAAAEGSPAAALDPHRHLLWRNGRL